MISKFYAPLLGKRAELENDERGFTLIELLVVVLIIGILAAIAIPVFLGQQNSAKDGAAKSDLANAKIAVVSYFADGKTTAPTVANLATYGYAKSADAAEVTFGTPAPTSTTFCIQTTSGSGKTFHINQSSGVLDNGC